MALVTAPPVEIGRLVTALGTITADAKLIDSTVTWNAGGVAFTAWKLNVTDTASAAASLLADLQVGGASKFSVTKAGAVTATTSSATAWSIGPNGATNPVFQADCSTGSQAAGLKVTGATSAGTVALAVISSGADANLSVDAKGTGTVTIAGTSTGGITLARATAVTGALNVTGTITASDNLVAGATDNIQWTSRSILSSPADGVVTATDSNGTAFLRFQFGGTTSSFPSLKRSSAALICRLADDSADAAFTCATLTSGAINATGTVTASDNLVAGTGDNIQWTSRSIFTSPSDGVVTVTDANGTAFTRFQFGGTTSSYPSIKRNGTALNFRLADDSADAPITAAAITASGAVSGTTWTGTGLIQTTLTTEQQRLRYDASNYISTTVGSTGTTTFNVVASGVHTIDFSSSGTTYLRVSPSGSGAGTTKLHIWDNDNGALENVTVGAADSGGSGFKVLRIPN